MALKGNVNTTSLSRIAETLDLEADAILAHMPSDEVSTVIAANHALAQRLKISGTPSFVMNDEMLRGYLPLEGMLQLADDIRSR